MWTTEKDTNFTEYIDKYIIEYKNKTIFKILKFQNTDFNNNIFFHPKGKLN